MPSKIRIQIYILSSVSGDFPHSSVGKKSACNAGEFGSIPGSGRSAGEGIGYPLLLLTWRIPWTVYSMGLQRVRHDSTTFTSFSVFGVSHLQIQPITDHVILKYLFIEKNLHIFESA